MQILQANPFFSFFLLAGLFSLARRRGRAVPLRFRRLDFSDLVSEAVAAAWMLVIINGYVQLSQLRTLFFYIGVDVGAAVGWGLIDALTYAIGQSISRLIHELST